MVEHFDPCLGCMACVPACPSGVQYDKLIEATRAQVERNHKRSPAEKALREASSRSSPTRGGCGGPRSARRYQRTGLQAVVRAAGCCSGCRRRWRRWRTSRRRSAGRRCPSGSGPRERRVTVGMLTGCVQRAFFPGVNAATARVLAMEGCEVVIPRKQGCCGALSSTMDGSRRRRRSPASSSTRSRRRRRAGGGQRGRLRLVHEGVRRPAGGRPGVRGPGGRVRGQGPGRHRAAGRARPGRAAAPARR